MTSTTHGNNVLVLRTVAADRTSHGGFVWPAKGGTATAPDWNPNPTLDCGKGLHGLLWGCGDGLLLSTDPAAIWQVVRVKVRDIANIDAPNKIRFREGKVVHEGDKLSATDYLYAHGAAGMPVVFGTATAGYHGTATAGESGTATAGYYGTATAGRYGTATAGRYGTATAGDYGTATAGDYGTATAGYHGTATAGESGTATADYHGTATAGYLGALVIKWWDGHRYHLAVAHIGEDDIKPNTPYRVNYHGEFVEVDA